LARLALTDAYIMTATRGVLDKGTIVIKDTRIEAIGTNIRVPPEAEVWSLRDKVVIPGMIDAHTHLGLTQDGVGAMHSDEDEVGRDQSRRYRV
jgi:imidazolonepropionase-like amidohydrolase